MFIGLSVEKPIYIFKEVQVLIRLSPCLSLSFLKSPSYFLTYSLIWIFIFHISTGMLLFLKVYNVPLGALNFGFVSALVPLTVLWLMVVKVVLIWNPLLWENFLHEMSSPLLPHNKRIPSFWELLAPLWNMDILLLLKCFIFFSLDKEEK